MLDQLLGRAALKDEVSALETECERLERRFDAERERRREAVRDRQAAEERINQLEDRIAGLEGELSQRRDGRAEPAFTRVETISRTRVPMLLDRLESFHGPPESALTAAVTDGVPESVNEVLSDDGALVDRASPCVVCVDDLLLVRVALAPPRQPDPFETWETGFALDRSWFVPPDTCTFALVRADMFAVATWDDGELTDIDGFESDVMGRHSKGGFSQARFERRRNEQIERHMNKCAASLEERASVSLYLVGDRRMISTLDADPIATAAVDASGSPHAALEDAFEDFWRTRLYVL